MTDLTDAELNYFEAELDYWDGINRRPQVNSEDVRRLVAEVKRHRRHMVICEAVMDEREHRGDA